MKKRIQPKSWVISKYIILLILIFAFFFRLYGLNWDQDQHLHPDERFLTMVMSAMKIPPTFSDFLNPNISTMNPYNLNYSFFVYGTFPLNLTKVVSDITNNNQYWTIHFVGRILSALFDVGVVFLLYLSGKKVFDEKTGLLAAFLYSIMVLPIQLSHFFAVDTFLNFFLFLSFYFLILLVSSCPSSSPIKLCTLNFELFISSAMGGAFGLALACKISALYFLPIIGLGYLYLLLKNLKSPKLLKLLISGIVFAFTALLVFRFNQPSAFSSADFFNWQINPKFVSNLKELSSFNNPDSWFPPAVQWKQASPIVFPLKNIVIWGMGLPLGIIAVLSVLFSLISLISLISPKYRKSLITNYQLLITFLSVFWILGLFVYQGIQFCKTMRYFLPIYPFLALLSGNLLIKIRHLLEKRIPKTLSLIINYSLLIAFLVYPVSFLSIYSRPISRVTASEWIYKNVPRGSVLTYEHWDDALPLGLKENNSSFYTLLELPLFGPDNEEKWKDINDKLKKADYIIMSSNRLFGSIPKNPDYYPISTKYYQSLFDGTSNFKKVAEFTSRPCFPPIGKPIFCFTDDNAEEAFTVYDHPKVLIFKKQNNVPFKAND